MSDIGGRWSVVGGRLKTILLRVSFPRWRRLWRGSVLCVLIGLPALLHAAPPDSSSTPVHPTRKLLLSTAVAAGALGLGVGVSSSIDVVHRDPLIGSPSRLDRFFRDHLHDSGRTTNFLDGDLRGSFSQAGGMAVMVLLEQLIDDQCTWKDSVHELAVFGTGTIAEQGFKLATKAAVARRRPRLEFATPATSAALNAESENHKSFYSGHASVAFYTASYVDQKVGDLLRPRVEGRARLLYRTFSITTLYGWAAYVGYSRMQIDRHYFTDVLAGGAVGASWGLWQYRYHHGRDGRWSVVPALADERVGVVVMVSRRY